ncbi:Transforming growth factor-beta-induced protein ig-h3 [Tolypocladium capitatum]|uniref:Transforming growth factor-beta-induced protein ig-h3 n=1 Tax=Tolypocladium capitatum TaxID=45235 RepID=A0A2K3QMB6_9HYPO|nr:Transforming growth factor-beta-induced protein ig-h3 [Tolypocladium capitatum]
MLLSKVLLGFAGLFVAVAVADDKTDLGSVLGANKNLTKYYDLIKASPWFRISPSTGYSLLTCCPEIPRRLAPAPQLRRRHAVNLPQIIAPSDKAFDNIPYTALNGQWDPEDKAKTVPLLQYHILQGNVSTKALDTGPTYVKTTLLTDPQYTNVTSGQNVLVNKQPGNVVVFTTSMGTRCSLVTGDIGFQGGLVQIVDNLLIPPARLGKTSEAFKVSSFLGGLYAAKLMPDTADRKNITVFAPQDGAFGLVGGSLEKMDAKQLARVMSYHIIPDRVLVSSAFANNFTIKTLATDSSGQSQAFVVIRQAGNNKYVNSAQIVQPDILIANGILHIISNVLNPDAESATPDPAIGTQAPVFPVSSIDGAFTSALPCTTNCPVTTTAASDVSVGATTTPTTSVFSSSSKGAAPARCTAQVAGAAAMGLLGVGAGLAPWL